MSITLLNQPSNAIQAVARPIIWDFTCNRVADTSFSVVSVVNNGGFAQYNIGLHQLEPGDIVNIEGVSTNYNGLQKITSSGRDVILTNKAYVDTLGAGGTCTRDNNSFRLKADVYKCVGDFDTITSVSSSSGSAKLNFGTTHSYSVNDLVAVSGTTKSFTITGISDNSGKVQYTIGSHNLVVGDVVTVAGETVDSSYNGTQKVIDVLATAILTNKDYVSTGTPTGTASYQVYDGVHTVTAVGANDITTDATFSIDITGKCNEVTLIGSKRAQEINDNGTQLFRFNFSNFLSSELTFDLPVLTSTDSIITTNTGSITGYSVTLTEQFEDENGLLQDQDSIQTDVAQKACNAALQHNETQNLDDWTQDNSNGRFLTNAPFSSYNTTNRGLKYVANDLIYLSFLTNETGTIQIDLVEFDSNGSIVASTNPASTTAVINRGIVVVDTSNFNASTANAEIFVETSGGTRITEKAYFTKDTKCYDREIKVWWLNRLGGFDFYRFTGDRADRIISNKKIYQKPLPNGFAYSDREDGTLAVDAYKEVMIYSDWIEENTADWLSEIFTSKHVYIEETIDGAQEYIPILVTNSSVVMSQSRANVQVQLTYKRPDFNING